MARIIGTSARTVRPFFSECPSQIWQPSVEETETNSFNALFYPKTNAFRRCGLNNPNGISDGLNYVEDCEDVEAYKRVFKMIFDALDQSQHYKMMTGKQLKS